MSGAIVSVAGGGSEGAVACWPNALTAQRIPTTLTLKRIRHPHLDEAR